MRKINFAFNSAVSSVVLLVGNIIAAKYVTPFEMGLYQSAMLIPAYLGLLQFGVFNGLNRNLTIYIAKGDQRKTEVVVDSSWAFARLVAFVSGFVSLILISCVVRQPITVFSVVTAISVLFVVVLEPFSIQMETIYSSTSSFHTLSRILFSQNAITLICSALPIVFGSTGLAVSRIVYIGSRFLLRYSFLPIRPKAVINWNEVIELSKVGVPLLVAGLIYTYISVSDRTIVAILLGPAAVGQMVLANIIVTALSFIPQIIAAIYYPEIVAEYGKVEKCSSIRKFYWPVVRTTSIFLIPACVLVYYSISPIVNICFPLYRDGIESAELAALSCVSLAYLGVSGIISATRKNGPYIICLAVNLLGIFVFGFLIVGRSGRVIDAVWIRTIVSTFICFFTLGYGYWLTRAD